MKISKARKKHIFLAIFLGLLICFSGIANAAMIEDAKASPTEKEAYAPGEVLVKFTAGAVPADVLAGARLRAAEYQRVYSIKPAAERFRKAYLEKLEKDSDGWYWYRGKNYKDVNEISDEECFRAALAEMPAVESTLYQTYKLALPEGVSVPKAVQALSSNPAVEYAEPNYRAEINAIPNDPYYDSEGSWGQDYDDLWGIKKLQCEDAWNYSEGEGVVVAVIDTGVDYNHEDLKDNIYKDADGNIIGRDFFNNDSDPMDDNGHGTHCAGTIAAVGNNGLGVVGVAPNAKIMAVKVFSEGGGGYVSDIINGVEYASLNGADVLSHSWGVPARSSALEDAFATAYGRGCVSVAASGNDNADVRYFAPANIDNVISVGATTQNDERCYFSNYGFSLDVLAPGGGYAENGVHNILSTMSDDSKLAGEVRLARNRVSGGYWRLAGTSMACPYAAGVVALIKAAYPNSKQEEILARLMAGCDDIDSLNPDYSGQLGKGRVNAHRSLAEEPGLILKIVDLIKRDIAPGKDGEIVVCVKSFWQNASDVTATLSEAHPLITIRNNTLSLGGISQGEVKSNTDNPFIISVDENFKVGDTISFQLSLSGSGFDAITANFSVRTAYFEDVGPGSNLPLVDFLPLYNIFEDYNNDGSADLFYVKAPAFTPDTISVYKRDGNTDGTFYDATKESRIYADGVMAYAPTLVDIYNKGYKDLFLHTSSGGVNSNFLFLNRGDGTFVKSYISGGSVSEPSPTVYAAIALDYNNDGFCDIYTGYEMHHNNGVGIMTTLQSGELGLTWRSSHFVLSVGETLLSLDYNSDGYQDIVFSDGVLYRNDGDGTFSDATKTAGLRYWPRPTKGNLVVDTMAAADYDNDGNIDLFMSIQERGRHLYHNEGNGTFTEVTDDISGLNHLKHGSSWGPDFFDCDNDGDLDLWMSGGGNYASDEAYALYINHGDGTFSLAENFLPPGMAKYSGIAAMADYNNDGAIDVHAPTSGLTGLVGAFLKNIIANDNNWMKVKLEGTQSNRDAYGARVYLTTGAARQLREVHTSPVMANPVHFGVGQNTIIDEIEVHWPSGLVQRRWDVDANQLITIVEENEPPILSPIGNKTVNVGKNLIFVVSARDGNDDMITYSVNPADGLAALPKGITLNGTTGAFSWTPTDAQGGVHRLQFTASDGEATDSETVEITVKGAGPRINWLGPTRVEAGKYICISGSRFHSPNGQTFIQLKKGSETVTFKPSRLWNDYMFGRIPAVAAGVYTLTVMSTKGESNAKSLEILPSVPYISGIWPYWGRAGQTATISGRNFGGGSDLIAVLVLGRGRTGNAEIVSRENSRLVIKLPSMGTPWWRYIGWYKVKVYTPGGFSNYRWVFII